MSLFLNKNIIEPKDGIESSTIVEAIYELQRELLAINSGNLIVQDNEPSSQESLWLDTKE